MNDIYDPMSRFDPSNQIHETAIIHESAVLGKNNIIGPGVIIDQGTHIGSGNRIGPYTIIGSPGEIRNVTEFHGKVIIGDSNTISEHVTIQRPAEKDASTVIRHHNIIMAHAHIGHDAFIGSRCEICTGTIVGGYAIVKDEALLKLGVTLRNRRTVGEKAVIGMGAVVTKEVLPGVTVVGNPARVLNKSQ